MAVIYTSHQEWHPGELSMHRLMSAPTSANPTSPYLIPSAAHKVLTSPILALGTLDSRRRPWTSIWGGAPGFARPMRIQAGEGEAKSAIGARCLVDGRYDPSLKALEAGGEEGQAPGKGRWVSGLAIDLGNRVRAKWAGTVVGVVADGKGEDGEAAKEVQMVVQVESSLGNCPKYLNKKTVRAAVPNPTLVPSTAELPQEALDIIADADCFFITTSNEGASLSTNYRGGPKGFIRVLPPSTELPRASSFQGNSTSQPISDSTIRLVYPEYSGNRLYQTLGNLILTPLAGIAIPNLRTGSVLYATCTAQILAGESASKILPRSNLAVVLTLIEHRLVKGSLGFTAIDEDDGTSPYNPPVRYAKGEPAPPGADAPSAKDNKPLAVATIVGREILGPNVARVTFETNHPVSWKRGQHVALSFAGELDTGYSHMRDEDPRSLNDDFVRTFTVTSPAPQHPPFSGTSASGDAQVPPDEGATTSKFDITIRNVGPCTNLLVKANPRAGIEIPILLFGGEFDIISRIGPGEEVVFVTGGIGVTPLVAQIEELGEKGTKTSVVWSVRKSDLELVRRLVSTWKGVKVKVFVAGEIGEADEAVISEIESLGVSSQRRRVERQDLDGFDVKRWFVCAGAGLGRAIEGWAAEKGIEIVGESFAY